MGSEQQATFNEFINVSFLNYSDSEPTWGDYKEWEADQHFDFTTHERNRRIALGFVLISFIIIGLLGNILVIYSAVKKCYHVNSAFYVFLVNLCAASAILLVFEYPLIIYENVFTQPWRMGKFFCQLHGYVQYCTFYGVAYALLIVIVFRLLQITIPDVISRFNNTFWAMILCCIKWCIIMLANISTWTGHGIYDEIEGSTFCYYKQLNENKFNLHTYLIVHFIFAFSLPGVIMVAILIFLVLLALHLPASHRYGNFNSEHSDQQLHRNTNILLISLIVIFLICWAPTKIFILLLGFDYLDFKAFIKLSIMSDVFMCFACAHPCTNPWLIIVALYDEFSLPWSNSSRRRENNIQMSATDHEENGSNGHLHKTQDESCNGQADLYGTQI